LLPSLKRKSLEARKKVNTCFTIKMGLIHYSTTHKMQVNFQEMDEETKHFITMMKHEIAGEVPCGIINMDQTPIMYMYDSRRIQEDT
jgi:hypothetical protein